MVIDAVGELCNMIAGGWKRRLGPEAEGLVLSLPLPCGDPNQFARRKQQHTQSLRLR